MRRHSDTRRRPFRVLFVCTANICRSPMAEGILNDLAGRAELTGQMEVHSAGVAAFDGAPASPLACDVSLEAGIDISRHRSRPVTEELLSQADLVLTMTALHHKEIAQRYPQSAEKVVPLRAYAVGGAVNGNRDIEDPYGGTKAGYQKCFDQLRQEIERIFPEIVDAVRAKRSW